MAGVGGAAWLEILSKNISRGNTPGGVGDRGEMWLAIFLH